MGRLTRLACAVAIVALGLEGPVAARADCPSGAWSSHTSVYAATAMAVDGGTLWVGSLFGGVLEWDIASAGGRIHSRTSHCLPDDLILDLAVAADGGLSGDVWIATLRGAARRPAGREAHRRWQRFDAGNSGLADPISRSVGVTAGGEVWVGTFETGAYRFDGTSWEHFDPFNSGLGNPDVTSIETAGETVWFGTWGGVFRLADAGFTRFTPANTGTPPGLCQSVAAPAPDRLGLTSGVVEVRHVDPVTGVVWISNLDDGPCMNSSTSRFDGESWLTFSTFNSAIASDRILGVATAPDGREVLTSFGGSQFYHAGDRSFTDIRFANGDRLLASAVARDGDALWFASPDRGLVRWRGGTLTVFTPPGLNDNLVQALWVDAAGGAAEVWVGNRRGAQRLLDGRWSSFEPGSSPIAGPDVKAVVRGPDGSLWFGTGTRGISRLSGGTWTTFDTGNSALDSNSVGSLAVDPANGDIWAAYSFGAGAARFDGVSWTAFPAGPEGGTTDLLVDHDGVVWFAGLSQVVRFDGVNADIINEGLPSTVTWALALGPDNEIYVGTEAGAARINRGAETWTALPRVNPHLNNIRALAVDSQGHLWAGAWDVGLAEFDGQFWSLHTTAAGLTNPRVHVIRIASDDTVWVGTEEGISIFDQNFVIPGDLNGDGRVGRADLLLLFMGWGRSGATDLNADGTTSRPDLTILLDNWG